MFTVWQKNDRNNATTGNLVVCSSAMFTKQDTSDSVFQFQFVHQFWKLYVGHSDVFAKLT